MAGWSPPLSEGSKTGQGHIPARLTEAGLIVAIRLTPKAGGDGIMGVETAPGGQAVLRMRVRAAPEDGKANAAAAALLAKWLDEPKSRAEVIAGGKSRLKQILIKGDAAQLMEKLASRLALLGSGD